MFLEIHCSVLPGSADSKALRAVISISKVSQDFEFLMKSKKCSKTLKAICLA